MINSITFIKEKIAKTKMVYRESEVEGLVKKIEALPEQKRDEVVTVLDRHVGDAEYLEKELAAPYEFQTMKQVKERTQHLIKEKPQKRDNYGVILGLALLGITGVVGGVAIHSSISQQEQQQRERTEQYLVSKLDKDCDGVIEPVEFNAGYKLAKGEPFPYFGDTPLGISKPINIELQDGHKGIRIREHIVNENELVTYSAVMSPKTAQKFADSIKEDYCGIGSK